MHDIMRNKSKREKEKKMVCKQDAGRNVLFRVKKKGQKSRRKKSKEGKTHKSCGCKKK